MGAAGLHRPLRGVPAGPARAGGLDLFGRITGLPAGTERVPWDGPRVRIVEHPAHAPGHAALLVEGRGVLVAGDVLSDVLVPVLGDPHGLDDPVEDHLLGLRLLEGSADDVEVVVPGHGSVGGPGQVRARIEQDRAHLHALRSGRAPDDPWIGPSARPGREWVADLHEGQAESLARRRDAAGAAGPHA